MFPVADIDRRVALVRTPQGLFLPGGGIESDETPRDAVVREVLDARPSGRRIAAREPDHELVWVTMEEAIAELAHPTHRWAVAEWGRGATFRLETLPRTESSQ